MFVNYVNGSMVLVDDEAKGELSNRTDFITIFLLQASLYIPFLILKARKFALLYSLGSVFIISR